MKQTSLTVALFLMAATRWAKRHVDIDLYKNGGLNMSPRRNFLHARTRRGRYPLITSKTLESINCSGNSSNINHRNEMNITIVILVVIIVVRRLLSWVRLALFQMPVFNRSCPHHDSLAITTCKMKNQKFATLLGTDFTRIMRFQPRESRRTEVIIEFLATSILYIWIFQGNCCERDKWQVGKCAFIPLRPVGHMTSSSCTSLVQGHNDLFQVVPWQMCRRFLSTGCIGSASQHRQTRIQHNTMTQQ